jgi:hypothetical protein
MGVNKGLCSYYIGGYFETKQEKGSSEGEGNWITGKHRNME